MSITTSEELDDVERRERLHRGRQNGVVTMIDAVLWIAGGLAIILVIAVVVGIVDAANAATWRQIAAERRDRWESRLEHHHNDT